MQEHNFRFDLSYRYCYMKTYHVKFDALLQKLRINFYKEVLNFTYNSNKTQDLILISSSNIYFMMLKTDRKNQLRMHIYQTPQIGQLQGIFIGPSQYK